LSLNLIVVLAISLNAIAAAKLIDLTKAAEAL